jgi:hypothetical protein
MATTQGDIAKPELPLGERPKHAKSVSKNDMVSYAEEINRINAERTKRYFNLIGKPVSDKQSRDGIIRRTKT